MAALVSDWLECFQLLCNFLNGIRQNLIGNKYSTSSTRFVFFQPIGQQDVRPGHWWDIFEFFLQPTNGFLWNLTGRVDYASSTRFLIFGRSVIYSGIWYLKLYCGHITRHRLFSPLPACQGGLLVCSLSVRPSVRHTSVFLTLLCRILRYWLEILYMNLSWHDTDQVLLCLTFF